MLTHSQQVAQRAYGCVTRRIEGPGRDEYVTQVRALPALIHSAGLCQAVAFLEGKNRDDLIKDLETVMGIVELGPRSRAAHTGEYQRLSREALSGASWLKRYSEALRAQEDA